MSTRNPDKSVRAEGCTAVEIQLAEYCAAELDPTEVELVEKHLATCASCRAELARERYLRGQLADLPLVSCPSQVSRRILAEISDDRQAHPSLPAAAGRRAGLVGGLAAAAAAFLLLFGTPDRPAEPEFTQAEITAARQDLKRTLILTARIIDRTERSTVKEVFGHTLPESLNQSLKTLMTTSEGGQG